jgi:hypothetical protein
MTSHYRHSDNRTSQSVSDKEVDQTEQQSWRTGCCTDHRDTDGVTPGHKLLEKAEHIPLCPAKYIQGHVQGRRQVNSDRKNTTWGRFKRRLEDNIKMGRRSLD